MKRALVTGGAGFIAHHLIGKLLKETDWEIIRDRLCEVVEWTLANERWIKI